MTTPLKLYRVEVTRTYVGYALAVDEAEANSYADDIVDQCMEDQESDSYELTADDGDPNELVFGAHSGDVTVKQALLAAKHGVTAKGLDEFLEQDPEAIAQSAELAAESRERQLALFGPAGEKP